MPADYWTITILRQFTRHDREYWIFSVQGNPHTFLYFSHRKKDLRALFYGNSFTDEIPRIEQDAGLCIECGLGTRIRGGVSLDGGEVVAFNCERGAANRLVGRLRKISGTLYQRVLDI